MSTTRAETRAAVFSSVIFRPWMLECIYAYNTAEDTQNPLFLDCENGIREITDLNKYDTFDACHTPILNVSIAVWQTENKNDIVDFSTLVVDVFKKFKAKMCILPVKKLYPMLLYLDNVIENVYNEGYTLEIEDFNQYDFDNVKNIFSLDRVKLEGNHVYLDFKNFKFTMFYMQGPIVVPRKMVGKNSYTLRPEFYIEQLHADSNANNDSINAELLAKLEEEIKKHPGAVDFIEEKTSFFDACTIHPGTDLFNVTSTIAMYEDIDKKSIIDLGAYHAFTSYTGGKYDMIINAELLKKYIFGTEINDGLYQYHISPMIGSYEDKNRSSAIEKICRESKHPLIVNLYRFTHISVFDNKLVCDFEVGDTFTVPTFLSTTFRPSPDIEQFIDFYSPMAIFNFFISCDFHTSFLNIQDTSHYNSEAEILLKPNLIFKVIAKNYRLLRNAVTYGQKLVLTLVILGDERAEKYAITHINVPPTDHHRYITNVIDDDNTPSVDNTLSIDKKSISHINTDLSPSNTNVVLDQTINATTTLPADNTHIIGSGTAIKTIVLPDRQPDSKEHLSLLNCISAYLRDDKGVKLKHPINGHAYLDPHILGIFPDLKWGNCPVIGYGNAHNSASGVASNTKYDTMRLNENFIEPLRVLGGLFTRSALEIIIAIAVVVSIFAIMACTVMRSYMPNMTQSYTNDELVPYMC